MKLYGRRRVEQAELLYKDSEVGAVLAMTSRQGWGFVGYPHPVTKLELFKVLGEEYRGLCMDTVAGWKKVQLERPLKKARHG